MGRLEGKVVIVTGASQGMGAEHVRRCVSEGARVVAADIDVARGEALVAELGANAHFINFDVTSSAGWKAAIAETEARFGPVTVLVNNAGIVGSVSACADLDEDEYLRICAINQTSVFLGMKHVIPSMKKAGGGSIVNISSISGIVAIFGTPNVAYAASKFALRGLTKQAAIEYGGDNIRVNSVHPGYIRTKMMTELLTDEQIVVASASVPIKRVGEPSDVSLLVIYLASDESGFTTGSEHVIDGGLTAL